MYTPMLLTLIGSIYQKITFHIKKMEYTYIVYQLGAQKTNLGDSHYPYCNKE